MRTAVILLFALVAFVAAQGVHVVDRNPAEVQVVDSNPSAVNVVDHNPSAGQGQPINNPDGFVIDQAFYQPSNPSNGGYGQYGQGQPLNNPDGFVIDQAFYRPSNPSNGGYEQISTGPEFVNFGNNQNRPYPGKQYDSPLLRGGNHFRPLSQKTAQSDFSGEQCMKLFLKRHPQITKRTEEVISRARAGVTEKSLENWFDEVHEHLEPEKKLEILNDPKRVVNLAEISVQICLCKNWKHYSS
ncbi:unnamed protein product [Parnassius apollo]|uniref:(apollo) hypothetical protein n=1 Tax=Parnassius apollo TaxID=110799 RepID=A0A8S3XZ80_PARAO|nr:unnamed protein product [Parnassius apollo]